MPVQALHRTAIHPSRAAVPVEHRRIVAALRSPCANVLPVIMDGQSLLTLPDVSKIRLVPAKTVHPTLMAAMNRRITITAVNVIMAIS